MQTYFYVSLLALYAFLPGSLLLAGELPFEGVYSGSYVVAATKQDQLAFLEIGPEVEKRDRQGVLTIVTSGGKKESVKVRILCFDDKFEVFSTASSDNIAKVTGALKTHFDKDAFILSARGRLTLVDRRSGKSIGAIFSLSKFGLVP